MKEIIYLDTDFIHSFLAQTNDGLPTSSEIENQEESMQQINKEQGFNSKSSTELEGKTGKLSIPAIVETPEGRVTVHIEPGKYSAESSFWSESDVGKEIISKQLHDNALNKLEDYLKKNGLITKISEVNGLSGYIELHSTFELIDLNLFEVAFSEKMVNMIVKESNKEKTEKLRQINASQLSDKEKKKLRDETTKEFENYKKDTEKSYPEYLDMLLLLKEFLPTSVFIKASNTVTPMKEQFMRESRNQLLFKYGNKEDGNKIKIIGKVTRQINKGNTLEASESGITDSLEQFKGLVDEVMVDHLKIISEKDYVINPIAVYFE